MNEPTGRIVYTPTPPHPCETPQRWTQLATGTQWQCNDCHQIWRLDPHGWARNGNPGKAVEPGQYHVYPDLADLQVPLENENAGSWVVLGFLALVALAAFGAWVAHLLGAPW
jgi:hypothetical protein